MLPSRALLFATAATLGLAAPASGCQEHGNADEEQADSAADGGDEGGGEAGEGGDDGPRERAKDDRIPALSGEPIGVQAGWVEGAMIYASARTSVIQELVQSLPMGPREARDFAKLGSVLGADPRVDDVLTQLGIAKDRHVSLSVRPVVTWAAEATGSATRARPPPI